MTTEREAKPDAPIRIKRPAFQFYPGDWLRSTDLRVCSVAARGLWIDMIALMHEGEPYGHLKVGRKVIHAANLASIVGASIEDVDGWLGELESTGVFSRDESGCIFSRRMVRDEAARSARAAGGKLGGNPALLKKSAAGQEDGTKVNHQGNLLPTPAVASAVASASAKQKSSERKRSTPVTFQAHLDELKANGKPFLPTDDPTRKYAEKVGITDEMLRLAFLKFQDRHADGKKRYTDWRATFRNSVKERWFKLWYHDQGTGQIHLTNDGLIAMQQFRGDHLIGAATA